METKKKTVKPLKSGAAAQDIYAMRKRRKRRKVLKQSVWLLLLAVVILVLYQRRDSWIPKLETMGMRHQSRQLGIGDILTSPSCPSSSILTSWSWMSLSCGRYSLTRA